MAPKETSYTKKALRYKVNGDCWEYSGTIGMYGYGQFGHRGKTIRAHRASYEIYNGKIPNGFIVCHTCDNRKCINPEHLYAGTYADNYNDARDRQRTNHPSGENHYNCKLTLRDVQKIRNSDLSQRKLASTYGVSQTTIGHIKRDLTWKTI